MAITSVPTVVPNPDPSVITSEAIDRRVKNAEQVIGARLGGMEKAVEVFQGDLTRVPTQLDRAIVSLRDLLEAKLLHIEGELAAYGKDHARLLEEVKDIHISVRELAAVTDQRFMGISEQFKERDTRTDQRAGDTKLAVDAAFAAAKEATSKIEAGFTKSIDGQQTLLNTTTKSTDEKIGDLKDRMTAMENRTAGLSVAHTESRATKSDDSTRLIGVLAIAVSLIVGIAVVVSNHFH
jgi:hypothetical protein